MDDERDCSALCWMNPNSTATIMQRTSSLLRSLRQQRKGVMVMAKQQKAWMPKPAKTSKTAIPDAIRSELESKAAKLIENVLKPKHVVPQKPDIEFNYVSDIGTKWYRKYFFFFSTYTCPGPNAISPSFESEFARMEYLGAGRFSLSFHRHTDQWVKLYAAQTVHECLKAIQKDLWFTP